MMIRNPILRGFNPDPSIVRVGDDIYIATSTFEWYPGVQIHHSRDLVNWRLVARPLDQARLLDLRGRPDGCGIWAPDLSHDGDRFHLVYTDVRRYGRTTVGGDGGAGGGGASLRDFHNRLVTAPAIDGPWSDPVPLNSSGFDPSLFHDADGRTYLLNMRWDHRPGRNRFAGIVMQEYDPAERRLAGEPRLIFRGTELGFTEAPHLYRHGDWYHLLVAEGGTGWNHAVTMARARDLFGPYETHPDGPVLTARGRPGAPLHRAGHGDLVMLADGSWWMAYLCGRPLPAPRRCVMGRETALQPVRWGEDGWLRTTTADAMPAASARAPALPAAPVETIPVRRVFAGPHLPDEFQWLRTPEPERLFAFADGGLRLFGRETAGSLFEQAMVARRQTDFRYSAAARIRFDPMSYQQAAGLICYYNGAAFHYLHVTHDEAVGRCLSVMSALPASGIDNAVMPPLPLPPGDLDLRVEVDFASLRFAWRPAGDPAWRHLPEPFDASILSDEATSPGAPAFTGTFVGVACQDMAGTARPADFAWFDYEAEPDYPPTRLSLPFEGRPVP